MKKPPVREAGRALRLRSAVWLHPSIKGVRLMRITFHVKDFTVTIMIKRRRNRHSAK